MTGYGESIREEWEQSTQGVVFDAVRRLTPGVSWSIVGTGGGCEALETYIVPTDGLGRAVGSGLDEWGDDGCLIRRGRAAWRVWVTDCEGASFDTFGPYTVGLYDDRDPESDDWTGEETDIVDGVALEDLAAQLVVFGRKAAEEERRIRYMIANWSESLGAARQALAEARAEMLRAESDLDSAHRSAEAARQVYADAERAFDAAETDILRRREAATAGEGAERYSGEWDGFR